MPTHAAPETAPDTTPRSVRIASVLFILCLSAWLLRVGKPLFITLLSAVLVAFILEPLVQLFMRFRIRRGLASFLACSVMLGTLYLALLGMWSQAVGFWQDMPNYSKRVNELVDTASLQIEQAQRSFEEVLLPPRLRQHPPEEPAQHPKTARSRRATPSATPSPTLSAPVQEVRIRQDAGDLVNVVLDSFGKFSDALLLSSFVPFLVYFFLSWRDHLRNSLLNLAGERSREALNQSLHAIAGVTRAYVVGNFLLGVVISIASSIFFYAAGVPYWQVAGPLSGFLSLIPYLGLPLAALPPIMAALPVFGTWGSYLVICTGVAVLHLVALNLLYPKLVGARVHLNPLVVTLSLMVWYVIWGGAGLVMAIPITAAMKAVFDNSPRMRGYARLLGD